MGQHEESESRSMKRSRFSLSRDCSPIAFFVQIFANSDAIGIGESGSQGVGESGFRSFPEP